MSGWNRSSTTRLVRKLFGPFAYAKETASGVEIGINKHGASVGIAWGADWQTAVSSFAATALGHARKMREEKVGAVDKTSHGDVDSGQGDPGGQQSETQKDPADDQDNGVDSEG